ncbi:MAG: hypothetical protein QOE64_1710, partial [Frankiales bacterium]|nr:hypothetical protein [Frankiales bacterium]
MTRAVVGLVALALLAGCAKPTLSTHANPR